MVHPSQQPTPKPDPPQDGRHRFIDSAREAYNELRGPATEIVHDAGKAVRKGFAKMSEVMQKLSEDKSKMALTPTSGPPSNTPPSPEKGADVGATGQPEPAADPGSPVVKAEPAKVKIASPGAAEPATAAKAHPTSPALDPPPSAAGAAAPAPAPPILTIPPAQPARPTSLWQWKAIQEEVDNYGEFAVYDSEASKSGGFQLVAARVRGVGHKHEGLNCDDCYEFRQSGPWTLIAVGDGAGTAKLSRVGSHAACQGAIRRLEKELREPLTSREVWTTETFRRDPAGVFGELDLEHVQQALHRAFADAVDAIDEAVREREKSEQHIKLLGRPPKASDFKTTLLLAAHTHVTFKGSEYSLAMTCQVGDGMIAAITRDWQVRILSHSDHGEYGSETKFLARGGDIEPAVLARRTFPLFGPIQSLLVMTDGVADIYFPPETQMLRLHGDLVVNKILPSSQFPGGEAENRAIDQALKEIGAPTLEQLGDHFRSDPLLRMKYVTHGAGLQEHRMPLIAPFAARIGVDVSKVLESPGLIKAATACLPSEIPKTDTPEQRLTAFLDILEVRGQRDDRTLVLLHPTAPAIIDGGQS